MWPLLAGAFGGGAAAGALGGAALPGLGELALGGAGFTGGGLMDNALFDPTGGTGGGTDWGKLLGSQGPSDDIWKQGMNAQAPQLPSAQGTLQGLMNMVGQPQQQQRPGQAYSNPYVSSLINV